MTLSLVHVVAGIGHEASGPSYSVPRLARALSQRGNDVTLHVLDWQETPSVPGVGVRIYPLLPFPRNLGLSPTMLQGIRRAARHADIVHNHGLWMAPNVFAWLARLGTPARLVVSPRGVFAASAMARSRARKRAMWVLGQGSAVRAAALLHATSEAEAEDIRRVGLRAPIAVLPNGIDLPTPSERRSAHRTPRRRLLYLGRVHPIKGLDHLLTAWSVLSRKFPDWELSLVGPDADDYGERLRARVRDEGIERVSFEGPRYGRDKQVAYENADLYVLPSFTENFGMTVAEALANCVPAVVTRGAPWAGLERERCGFWIEHDAAPLANGLERAMALSDEERRAMGERGRSWMAREFGWAGIAANMEAAYLWVLGRGPRPEFVRTD